MTYPSKYCLILSNQMRISLCTWEWLEESKHLKLSSQSMNSRWPKKAMSTQSIAPSRNQCWVSLNRAHPTMSTQFFLNLWGKIQWASRKATKRPWKLKKIRIWHHTREFLRIRTPLTLTFPRKIKTYSVLKKRRFQTSSSTPQKYL